METNVCRMRKIITATNKMDGIYYQWAKKTDVKESKLTLLYALNDGKPHTQKQISEGYMIPKTTINTVVRECIDEGLITMKNEINLKEKSICLTEKGEEYNKRIMRDLIVAEETAIRKTLEKYSSEFIEAFEYLVQSMESEVYKK